MRARRAPEAAVERSSKRRGTSPFYGEVGCKRVISLAGRCRANPSHFNMTDDEVS